MDCAVNGVVSGVEPKTFGICVTLHVQEVLRTYNNNWYERSIAVLRFGGNFEVEDGLGLENTFGRVVCCFLRLWFGGLLLVYVNFGPRLRRPRPLPLTLKF